jgi:aminoglycoside phosphotransferase (APT) family kinase protein
MNEPAMKIPATLDEVTPAWLSEVLGADIRAVEIVDAHSGTTGRAKIRIDTSADLPETLFVKLQPFDEEQQAFLAMIGLGVSEATLYAAAGADLPVRVPKVWHASCDEADSSFIMVLEDLDAAGCRFATPDDDDVLSVAESLMDELATLHAAYWGQELEWLADHALSPGDSPEAQERMSMGAMIVQSALDQFATSLPPEFQRMGERYIAHNREIGSLWNEGERTLIHGDNHIGNLFVEAGRTGFYDWAVASCYPGMRDVAYFLCNSLPTDVRRAEQDALLARYRAGLAAAGIDLDASLAQEQYRLFSIYSWISATTTAAMGSKWQPVEVGWRATERTTQALIDLDVLGLLDDRLGRG